MKTALIVGATGLVGKQIINSLITDDRYDKILVLSRRELRMGHPKIFTKLINFDQLEELTLDEKVDECYCALGTTQKKSGKEGLQKVDYEYVLKTAQLCVRKKISKFAVVSSQGANYNSSFFYMRTKGQMEEAVKKVGIESVYIVRPSLITGDREEFRFAEELAYYTMKVINPLLNGKAKKYRSVAGTQIARCMVDLLQNPEKGNFTIESDVIQTY